MNITSAATVGAPYLSVYVGTKGFISAFTRALNAEMRAEGKNIEVIGIQVGNVLSGSNNVETNFFTPTSRRMARSALARVGCGRMVVAAYWPHWLQLIVFDIFHEKIAQGWIIAKLKPRKDDAYGEKNHAE